MRAAFGMPLKKEKRERIKFRVHLAEHCNLNCCGCDHFSPLAEQELTALDEYRKDMERMGVIFNHECDEIGLLGGEPLLHPDVIEFLKIARDNFSHGIIKIITNGILLPQMSDDFWQVCHDNDIRIEATHYPIKLDVEKIDAQARKFAVKFQWFGQSDDPVNSFCVRAIDLSGEGDARKNFALCDRANECVMLSHGRLFPCTFIPTVRHFNRKFGKNIPVTESDSVDIYSESNKDAILGRLSEPFPVCRYCDVKKYRTVEWHTSKRDIGEWL